MNHSGLNPYEAVPTQLLRETAEALVHVPQILVLEGPMEKVAWATLVPLGYKRAADDSLASSRLSAWIIHVVGDPDLCPDPNLRIGMLLLYRTVVNIDDGNREQALESLMSACAFLDRHGKGFSATVKTSDIIDCLNVFTQRYTPNYMKLGVILAEKLRYHRNQRQKIQIRDISNDYGMGLKALAVPKELYTVTALLKYVSDGAYVDKTPSVNIEKCLDEASTGLLFLVENFKLALHEPELIGVTAESIIKVMEAVITWAIEQEGHAIGNLDCLWNIDMILGELCSIADEEYNVRESPMGREMIRGYKGRISNLKARVIEDFFEQDGDGSYLYDFFYHDIVNDFS